MGKPGIRSKPRSVARAKAELKLVKPKERSNPISQWLASLFRRLLGRG